MKILLPIDGSEPALEAVRLAIRLAGEGLRASFVLANVQEPSTLYEVVSVPDPQAREQASEAAGTHLLAPAEALLRHAGLDFESTVVSGEPGNALVDVAEDYGCEMVIMETRGTGGLRSALLGSVSQSVLHGASMPVLLVKPVGG